MRGRSKCVGAIPKVSPPQFVTAAVLLSADTRDCQQFNARRADWRARCRGFSCLCWTCNGCRAARASASMAIARSDDVRKRRPTTPCALPVSSAVLCSKEAVKSSSQREAVHRARTVLCSSAQCCLLLPAAAAAAGKYLRAALRRSLVRPCLSLSLFETSLKRISERRRINQRTRQS